MPHRKPLPQDVLGSDPLTESTVIAALAGAFALMLMVLIGGPLLTILAGA